MKYIFLILVLSGVVSLTLEAMPAQILIIRHAEKPVEGDALSTKGRERAAALTPYLTETKELINFGMPIAIYAMAPSKEFPSKRAIETVTPLANQLKLTLKDSYQHNDYKTMVEEIKKNGEFEGRCVLICWEHDLIPEIARAFSALQTPATWRPEIFDRIWLITYSPTKKALFQNLPQQLLFGDAPK